MPANETELAAEISEINQRLDAADHRNDMLGNNNNNHGFERHAQTALTSLVVALLVGVAAFIFKINENQNDQLLELRELGYQMRSIGEVQKVATQKIDSELDGLTRSYNTIWSRLRAGTENAEILRLKVETLCNCEIDFNDPEPF